MSGCPDHQPARDSSWQVVTIARGVASGARGSDVLETYRWLDRPHHRRIDQTALPHRLSALRITTVDELVDAIARLVVRGAPLLGVAGALGVALAARQPSARGGTPAGWTPRSADRRRSPDRGSTCAARYSPSRPCSPTAPKRWRAAALAVRATAIEVSSGLSVRGAALLLEECGAAR